MLGVPLGLRQFFFKSAMGERRYRSISVFSHSRRLERISINCWFLPLFAFFFPYYDAFFCFFFLMSSLTSQIEKGNAKDIWGVVIESPSLLGFLIIFSKLSWKTVLKLPYSPTLNLFHPPCPLCLKLRGSSVALLLGKLLMLPFSGPNWTRLLRLFWPVFFFFPFLSLPNMSPSSSFGFFRSFFLLCTRWNFAKFHTFLSVFLSPH